MRQRVMVCRFSGAGARSHVLLPVFRPARRSYVANVTSPAQNATPVTAAFVEAACVAFARAFFTLYYNNASSRRADTRHERGKNVWCIR